MNLVRLDPAVGHDNQCRGHYGSLMAVLLAQDVGGDTIVSVDGRTLKHNERVQVNPGAKIGLGDFAMFQVIERAKMWRFCYPEFIAQCDIVVDVST